MPHIRAVFPANQAVREFLKRKKVMLRAIVSEETGYSQDHVALIPEEIARKDLSIADNVSALEFVIETGKKVNDRVTAERCAANIKRSILASCGEARTINFGVWVRAYPINGYTEHKPG